MEKNYQRHLVIGGGGYVGSKLALALINKGYNVTIFDLREPTPEMAAEITFIKGDVTRYDDVKAACVNIDCVYHLASYGMSGREQLNRKRIETVNVGGTENVIKACLASGVTRLVYTSTYNVVFGGQEIINGDESLPYLPLEKHPDHYSRTKSIAEMKILSANGTRPQTGDGQQTLRTCALRLAGVYGPGEERHLPRIVISNAKGAINACTRRNDPDGHSIESYIQRGLFAFTYGSKDSLVEFLHADNLVQAHVLAAEALTVQKKYIAAGQAYFISDCLPVNNFVFFQPLVEGLGYTYPTINVPVSLIYVIALLTELIHGVVGRVYNFQPLLTRTEVYKTGVTHYFNNGKAHRELGYKPTVQNAMESVVEWYIERGYHRNNNTRKKSQFISFVLSLFIAVAFAFVLFSWLPMVQ